MGGKFRAWACAGFGWVIDDEAAGIAAVEVLFADGERPVLVLPPGLTHDESEVVFGWALTEVYEQQLGWLTMLRAVLRFSSQVGEHAAD